jgi:(2R)-sulfolactate sulfo-lyase subunit beta
MDTPAAGAECLTLFAAGGAALQVFTTGQGNPIGNAITPVLKITANSRTAEAMREHIDVDVSGVIAGEMSLEEAADAILTAALRVASGRLTAAEVRGHQEFVLTRLHRSL